MGDSEEQEDLLKQEQLASRKEILAGLFADLRTLGITMAQAAIAMGYKAGTLRNRKAGQDLIDSLQKYIKFENQIRDYFEKLNNGNTEGLSDDFIANASKAQYYTKQQVETLAILKEFYASYKAYTDYGVKKDAAGNEQLEKEIHDNLQKAALTYQLTPEQHKSKKNTIYRKDKVKKNDTDQSTPPEEQAQ